MSPGGGFGDGVASRLREAPSVGLEHEKLSAAREDQKPFPPEDDGAVVPEPSFAFPEVRSALRVEDPSRARWPRDSWYRERRRRFPKSGTGRKLESAHHLARAPPRELENTLSLDHGRRMADTQLYLPRFRETLGPARGSGRGGDPRPLGSSPLRPVGRESLGRDK